MSANTTTTTLRSEATIDQIIARRLTRIRKSASISIEDMAMLTGIPAEILAENETGSEPMSLSRLRTIAAALDTTVVILMTRLLFPVS